MMHLVCGFLIVRGPSLSSHALDILGLYIISHLYLIAFINSPPCC